METSEGCAIEFFQQIDQMGFEQWNGDAIRTITYIKDELTNRMDDLIWLIQQIDQQLLAYKKSTEGSQKNPLDKVFPYFPVH